MRLFLLIALIAFFVPLETFAEKRMGLVIGNDAYTDVPKLDKANGDARAMSRELTGLGFEVMTVLDAPRRLMNARISEFTRKLEPGDTALVFFAGHGVEIDGENYLLPIDIAAPETSGEDFIKYESIALSDLLDRVQATGAKTTLVFLDACRDNPFRQVAGRSIGGSRGLARILAPEGTFVVFSAGAKQQALDRLDDNDQNENSIFTRLLLPKLRKPDLELRQLVAELRLEVRDLAKTQNHDQFPAYYDELLGQFYFSSTRGLAPVDSAPVVAVTGTQIRTDFELAERIGTALAYETFLEKYNERDDDLSVALARNILSALQGDGANEVVEEKPLVVASVPTPQPSEATRHLEDRKAVIRASQQKLNALGCKAGGADGVIGGRTRAAFANFINQSGVNLKTSTLGSQYALDVLNSESGIVCKASANSPVVVKPSASINPQVSIKPPAAVISAAPSSLAGSWRVSATCPLFITAKGTMTITKIGEGRYKTTQVNSLGQKSVGELYEKSGRLTGTNRWSTGAKTTFVATLSSSRRSFSGAGSTGCKFTATK